MSSKSMINKKVDSRLKGTQQVPENAKFRKKGNSLKTLFDLKDNEAFTTFKLKGDDAEGSDDTIFIFPRNWPEWSDVEINLEGWKTEDTAKLFQQAQFDYYHDPEGILLPHSLIGILDSWKRPREAFSNQSIILYDDTVDVIDIISNNKHLLNSRCMRWIISSIATVQVIADESIFSYEGEHSQFTPSGGIPWRPWHHIYSLCKAGKAPHKPLINPTGKYVIRLFYLGCWRKFVVDDKLPFDSKGRILLPASNNKGELWPMLLAKGLLKIASHTWNKKEDLNGFQPISCLTGWICEEISNIEFDDLNLWKLIKKLTEEKRETIEETPEIEINTVKKPKKGSKSSKEKTSSQQVRKAKPTEIVGILRFWNEKYNSNEVVHQIFNEEKLPSPKGISTFEPIRRMNFPVLFQQYKEKEIRRSGIRRKTSEYFGKELKKKFEYDKQDVPECFIKAYSHIFDLKEEPPQGHVDENKEEPVLEVKKSAKETNKSLMSKSSKLLKPSKSSVTKSAKGKTSALLRKSPNTQKIMADTGKWLTFSSLKSLLDGIVLIHKPTMFTTNIQKPDFNRLFLQKVPSKTLESMDDADDESELDSELDCEEELFIFLDSPNDVELVLSMNILPKPTKLDDNYGTLFDLMINACEGRDEEYLNYKSSNQMHESIHSVLIDEILPNKREVNHEMALSKDWMESYDEYEYELIDANGDYVLKESMFDEKDAEVLEVCEGDAFDEEGEEWEVDEYIVEMYYLGDFVKKKCKERVHILKSEDERDNNAFVVDGLTPQNSFSNKEEESERDKDGLEKYLLSRKLTSILSKDFSTTGEIEAFTGDFLFSQWPHSTRNAAHLELEVFKWDGSNVGHPSLQFCVTNTKVVHFELPPGRNILRVTIRSASFYALHILSNVGVIVSSKEDLYPEMMKDCARLTHYDKKIRQNIENVAIKLAEHDYLKTIRDFNNCYLPDNYHVLPRDTKELLHEAFQGSIYKILTENSITSQLTDVVKALRVVFLNPSFGKNKPEHGKISKVVKSISIQQNKTKLNLPDTKASRHQEAALKIQSFFKSILCRKILRSLQKNRSLLSTRLSFLHNLLSDKSEISIIRTMLNETPILKMAYDLKQDLENEINMYEWAGLTMDIENQTWIPLVRYIFKWDSNEPIKSSIQLTCPLTPYITSIIDNDTGKQLPRINSNCSPYLYKENRKGYTFFAYGVNENQSWSFVPWKINHIVIKGSPSMQINGQPSETGKPPKLRCDTLNGYYLPNKQKTICSFLMKLTELSHISLCFSTSNKFAVFKLELFSSNIGLITAEEAEGMLVIPSMFLEGPDTVKGELDAVYSGKVTLLNDWPLSDYQTKFTDMQWIKDTALFKDPGAYHVPTREYPKFLLPGSPMDFIAKQEENLMGDDQAKDKEPARWSLHILLDSPHGVTLEEIKQKGEKIKNMKREWEEAKPSILQKNAELYKTYKENGFKNCFGYSKKEPTRFKNKLPLMNEFQESDDEDKGPENSKHSDSKLKTDSKKSVKSNKKQNRTLDNSSSKSNESLLESESICDITPQNELRYKSGAAYDDHWVDHPCGIDRDDINTFTEMSNDNESNIKSDNSENKNEHSNIERRGSSEKSNENIFSKASKSIACKELDAAQKSDLIFNCEKQDKYIEPIGKCLKENVICSDNRIKGVDFEDNFHGHTEEEDEKCGIDHYKSYYESHSDDASCSSHDELNVCTTPKVMTVEDWVKIQTKMVKKQEQFKKRLIKVFTEVESLVRAPFKDHFKKWNLYLVQTLKNTEDPFHQIEKLRNAYRRAKKKQNILRKQKIKLEIKRIRELKAGMGKKGKKGKNKNDDKTMPKKEKKTKAK